MYITDTFMVFMCGFNLFLLSFKVSRFLKFLMFAEMFLMKIIFLFPYMSVCFEMSMGSTMFVMGACETSVGFTLLVSQLRSFSKEMFRKMKSHKCEGF